MPKPPERLELLGVRGAETEEPEMPGGTGHHLDVGCEERSVAERPRGRRRGRVAGRRGVRLREAAGRAHAFRPENCLILRRSSTERAGKALTARRGRARSVGWGGTRPGWRGNNRLDASP